ncbi:MAG: hypothetical protein HOW59_06065 [Nonomuraea sp.]|nr:hypothetical protein [Nonomuraea sp.]
MSAIPLTEAKAHLDIPASGTTQDTELQRFLDAAEAAVTRRTGPLVATSVTSRVYGGGRTLLLPVYPVTSVTSVTPVGGTAASLTGVSVGPAGLLQSSSGVFYSLLGAFDVVYTAGWADVAANIPADLRLGVLELLRHLWQTQRGNSPGVQNALPDDASPVFGNATTGVPSIVEQLIGPYVMTAGFA